MLIQVFGVSTKYVIPVSTKGIFFYLQLTNI